MVVDLPRVLHLRNETGQRNLADESVANVQEGIHSRDKGRGSNGNGRDDRGAASLCCACSLVDIR